MRWTTATTAAAESSTTAMNASTWSVPYSGTSQNAVTNVPTMLPAVEIEKSRPAVRPSRSMDVRGEADGDRRDRGEHDAHRAEQEDRRDERVQPRAGIPRDDLLEHPLVDDGDREHEHGPERDRADEEVRRRPAVGEDAARPVPDRKPREDDADERSPDVERAAERRRQDAAGGDLDPEERSAREEDGGAESERVDGRSAALHPLKGRCDRRAPNGDPARRSRCVPRRPAHGRSETRRNAPPAGIGRQR